MPSLTNLKWLIFLKETLSPRKTHNIPPKFRRIFCYHLYFPFFPGNSLGVEESKAMKFHGNVRGEVRVKYLALFVSKPHIFMWFPHFILNCSCECSFEHCHSKSFLVPDSLLFLVFSLLFSFESVSTGLWCVPGFGAGFVLTLDGQNRQSLAFSERGQLSQAIPQFHHLPCGTNVKRMNANHAMRITAQRTQGQ